MPFKWWIFWFSNGIQNPNVKTKMLAILNPFHWFCFWMLDTIYMYWNGPFQKWTILNPNVKMFGFQMGSVFKCSVSEPSVYWTIQQPDNNPFGYKTSLELKAFPVQSFWHIDGCAFGILMVVCYLFIQAFCSWHDLCSNYHVVQGNLKIKKSWFLVT